MKRCVLAGTVLALVLVGMTSDQARAVNPVYKVEWVNGSGNWNDANKWRNINTNTIGDATAIMGQGNGSDGMNTLSMATTRARDITIGNGATVTYPGNVIGDLRLKQGTSLTITDGATWVQPTTVAYTENIWTQMDPDNLILDNGHFIRSGESGNSPADGGGIMMFGSFRGDDNFARLGAPQKTNVVIKNGGSLQNTGQLWFGADDEHATGTRILMTINNGSMNLTGGTIPLTNSTLSVDADLAFFYDYSESLGRPKNEEYEVNFTGPGTITVDAPGINVYRQDEFSIWTGGAAVSYLDLWNQGILKARGLSGKTGTVSSGINGSTVLTPANFSDFFSVSGTVGSNDYTLTSTVAPIQEVVWRASDGNGGDGNWNDANAWRNTTTSTNGDATAIMGQGNGSDGMNTLSLATTRARNITIGGGATVTYPGNVIGDLRIKQGSSLTIKEGATWIQPTTVAYTENIWTQFDADNLILDNGRFIRSGESGNSPADGGGIIMFGSFRGDDNFARLGAPQKTNIVLRNGSRMENTGQMWFGADDEHAADTRISMTINEGDLDLTGGHIPLTNSTLSVDADLAFFYDYSESLGRPKNEEYEINFTGPGSITVDASGINVYTQDEFSIWTGGAAISYLDLWNLGILKANGLSGKTGTVSSGINGSTVLTPANFNDFFTVSGTVGSNDYILNSLIEASPEEDADYNDDGTIDAADYVAGRKLGLDLDLWQQQFGQSSPGSGGSNGGGSGGVPEPGTMLLMLLGFASVSVFKTRSR